MTDTEGTRGGTRVWAFVAVAVAVVAVSGLAAGLATQTQSGPTADSVLNGVEQRYDDAESYTGLINVTATYDNGSTVAERSGSVRVLYAAPDSYRVEGVAPDRAAGTVTATNGSVAWARQPGGTTVVRPLNETESERFGQVEVGEAVDRLQENATVTYEGTETRDGVETYVLDIAPEEADDRYEGGATVWVDAEDYRLRAMETVASHDGTEVTTTTTFESVSFGVDVHESTFQPPTDRQVVVAAAERSTYESLSAAREAVSFELATPEPPAGFDLQEVAVASGGEEATVTATYAGENETLAVVQSERDIPSLPSEADTETVTVGDREAQYVETDDYGVVFWSEDGRTTAVTGTVERDRLLAVAASLD